MSEKKSSYKKNPARAGGRSGQHKNENVQFVRRVPEVNGTPYTEGMSEAYWKGMQDGESTAARMVRRSDPRNVRVRSLAVISDEPEEQGIALNEDTAAGGQIAVHTQPVTAPAVIEPEKPAAIAVPEARGSASIITAEQVSAPPAPVTPPVSQPVPQNGAVIGLRSRESFNETVSDMNSNNTSRTPAINTAPPPSAPEVTYSLRGGQINGSRMKTVSTEADRRTPTGGSSSGKKGNDKKESKAFSADSFVQPWREISLLRKVIIILSVLLFIYALLPLVVGIFNVGTIPLALIAWFFFTVSLLWNHIEGCRSRLLNGLFAGIAVAVMLGILGMAFISGKMIGASLRTLPEDRTEVTIVVLGCLVIDDRPSLMLERRLETAAEYLLSNPQAHCIVTGGQGENEDYPEAVIMRNYLVDAGVSDERIIVEKKSTSTVENIEFAADLIEKYNCHDDVVIVSDRFHQYRAGLAAKDAGLNSYAMPCDTAWYLVAHYWFREMAGIVQIWLQG